MRKPSRNVKLILFGHGTGCNNENTINLLSEYSASVMAMSGNVTQPEVGEQFAHVLNGPSAVPKHEDSTDYTPGTYTYDPDTGIKTPLADNETLRELHQMIKHITGELVGDGVEDNIIESLLVIKKISDSLNPGDTFTVNMVGFSRGADTTPRLANMLDHYFPNIEVNILAYDSVPGPTHNEDRDAFKISRNVREYTAIIAEDESRSIFKVQDKRKLIIEDPTKTKVSILNFPGQHGDMVRFRGCLTPPGGFGNFYKEITAILNWDLTYKFLKRHGVKLKDDKVPDYRQKSKSDGAHLPKSRRPNDKQIRTLSAFSSDKGLSSGKRLFYYSKYKENIEAYRARRGDSPLDKVRDFVSHKEDYVMNSDFFINQEHRELFKEHFPKTFDYLFQKGLEGATRDDVVKEFNEKDSNDYHDVKQNIKRYLRKDTGTEVGMGSEINDLLPNEPQGHYCIEKSLFTSSTEDYFELYDEIMYLEQTSKQAMAQFLGESNSSSLNEEVTALGQRIDDIKVSDRSDKQKSQLMTQAIFRAAENLSQHSGTERLVMSLHAITNSPEALATNLYRMVGENLPQNRGDDINTAMDQYKKALSDAVTSKGDYAKKNLDIVTASKTFLNNPCFTARQAHTLHYNLNLMFTRWHVRETYADVAVKQLQAYIDRTEFFQFVNAITGRRVFNKDAMIEKIQIANDAITSLNKLVSKADRFSQSKVDGILTEAIEDNADVRKKYNLGKSQSGQGELDLDKGQLDRTLRDIRFREKPHLSAEEFKESSPSFAMSGP